MSRFLPGVTAAEIESALESKSIEQMESEWTSAAPMLEALIRARWASPGPLPEQRLVFPLLQRKWPAIKAALEGFLAVRRNRPREPWREVAAHWSSTISKEVVSLCELPYALWLESVDGAQNASAPHVLEFAKDLQALLNAADRVQSRWLAADKPGIPDNDAFRADVAKRLSETLEMFTGIPGAVAVQVLGSDVNSPLHGVLVQARQELSDRVKAMASRCTSILSALRGIYPDLPLGVGHRPSTAQRDHRLMLLADAGAQVSEIVKYVNAKLGKEFDDSTVEQAILRARRRAKARLRTSAGAGEGSQDK
jgi:hypothetical protein